MSGASSPPQFLDNSLASAVGKPADAVEFEWCYKEAYNKIDTAITFATENKHDQAASLFEAGLTLLDRALAIKVAALPVDFDTAQHYGELQAKMRMTRKEVLQHFSSRQLFAPSIDSSGSPCTADAPPSYEQSMEDCASAGYPRLPDQELTPAVILPPASVGQLSLSPAGSAQATPVVTPVLSPQEGELLFRIDDGVQIFFILADGRVTSPSHPSFLEIVTFNTPLTVPSPHFANGSIAGGYLQVGEWSYPLVRASSPVLHSFYGAYLFPDPSNNIPGSHVGVIIPDSVSPLDRELYEGILTEMTSYLEQQQQQQSQQPTQAEPTSTPKPRRDSSTSTSSTTSERIAAGLVAGAEAISTGVVWGAGKMSELFTQWSEHLQTSSPAAVEGQTTRVDPKLQTTAKAARVVSGQAVRVSGYLLGQVGKATLALGRRLAPHVQHHGTRAYTSITGQTQHQASSQVDGALEVAAGVVKGASTIYMGLEKAAETLARSLADNTVKVVRHKYGADAGQFTDDTMYAVGQSAMAGHNIASLGVKGVAKRAAKDTGKALVISHQEKKKVKEIEAFAVVGSEGVVEGMEIGEEVGHKEEKEEEGFLVVERGVEFREQDQQPSAAPRTKKSYPS